MTIPNEFFVPSYYSDPDGNRAASAVLEEGCNNSWNHAITAIINPQYPMNTTNTVNYLMEWVNNCQSVSTKNDSQLFFTYKGIRFVASAIAIQGMNTPEFPYIASWLNSVYLPCAKSIGTHWNNWGVWGLYGQALMTKINGSDPSELISTVKNHYKRANWQIPIITKPGLLWLEAVRNNGGLWYHYFALAGYLKLALWINELTQDTELLGQVGENLETYFQWCQKPNEWPYSTKTFIGKIEKILTNSQNSMEMPYPNNSWPANLFKVAAEIYNKPLWKIAYSDFGGIGQNYFIFPDVYIGNNLCYNPYVI